MANDNISAKDLTDAIRLAISSAIAEARPEQPANLGEYMNRPENREPDLERPVFQHGHPIQIRGCSQDTIDHCNSLEPGEYIGGRVTVRKLGTEPHTQIHIDYPWQDSNERMINAGLFSSFSDLVLKINKEQRQKAGKK